MQFDVTCENKNSYVVAACHAGKWGKPTVLVRCNRLDSTDNERGRLLALKIANFLNSIPDNELHHLLSNDQNPHK